MEQRTVMKLCYAAVLGALCAVLFLFDNTQQDFESCAATAAERYPTSKPVPLGQPFNDTYNCMVGLGYALTSQAYSCALHTDYTTFVMDYHCYRPTNLLRGYMYDVRAGLHWP